MHSKAADFIARYRTGIKSLPHALYRFVFPETGTCRMCKGEGEPLCVQCAQSMRMHTGILCEKCGRAVEHEGLCAECIKNPRPYDKGTVALFYEGVAQRAMKDFKFENKLPYAEVFADKLYEKLCECGWDIDIVTAVPTHPLKAALKWYNPPAMIARKLADRMGIAYRGGILKRTRYTKPVSRLRGIDRMAHARSNFKVHSFDLRGLNILIVDDVSTTGSTLHVCAGLLKEHGAGRVYVAAACGDTSKDWYGESAQGIV